MLDLSFRGSCKFYFSSVDNAWKIGVACCIRDSESLLASIIIIYCAVRCHTFAEIWKMQPVLWNHSWPCSILHTDVIVRYYMAGFMWRIDSLFVSLLSSFSNASKTHCTAWQTIIIKIEIKAWMFKNIQVQTFKKQTKINRNKSETQENRSLIETPNLRKKYTYLNIMNE